MSEQTICQALDQARVAKKNSGGKGSQIVKGVVQGFSDLETRYNVACAIADYDRDRKMWRISQKVLADVLNKNGVIVSGASIQAWRLKNNARHIGLNDCLELLLSDEDLAALLQDGRFTYVKVAGVTS